MSFVNKIRQYPAISINQIKNHQQILVLPNKQAEKKVSTYCKMSKLEQIKPHYIPRNLTFDGDNFVLVRNLIDFLRLFCVGLYILCIKPRIERYIFQHSSTCVRKFVRPVNANRFPFTTGLRTVCVIIKRVHSRKKITPNSRPSATQHPLVFMFIRRKMRIFKPQIATFTALSTWIQR